MVFGLKLGVPTVVIGWGHKYFEVMKRFGQEAYVFDFETANVSLAKCVREVLDSRQEIISEIEFAYKRETLFGKQFNLSNSEPALKKTSLINILESGPGFLL